jgi:hypothetical protein
MTLPETQPESHPLLKCLALIDSASSRKCALQGVKFRPRVADTDYWLIAKFIVRNSLILHPGAIDKTIFACFAKPALTAEFLFHETIIRFIKMVKIYLSKHDKCRDDFILLGAEKAVSRDFKFL